MKSLQDLNILAVMDTSNHDLTTQFFMPFLSNSIRYDRGVGFFSSGWLRLNNTGEHSYSEPKWIKLHRLRETQNSYSSRPTIPGSLILRDYQEEAILAWFNHECRRLLEMATGTGKTITALAASIPSQ
jgi:Type III restriction enzyme, res subunit